MEPWTLEDVAAVRELLGTMTGLLWVFVSMWLVWLGYYIMPEFWFGRKQTLGDRGDG